MGLQFADNQETVDEETRTRLLSEQKERQRSAMADFRLALALAGKGPAKERPTAEQLNTTRHYLCFLCYEAGQYYDAAVLGDFLARHAAESTEGREGAKIMLASFIKLYGESKQTDKSFETKKIRETAEYIIEHWPTEPEAEDAALSLLNFAIADRRLDDALGYLNRISADSPRRGQSDLYAGQALWAAYLKAAQAPADERPPQAGARSLQISGPAGAQGGCRADQARGRAQRDDRRRHALAGPDLSRHERRRNWRSKRWKIRSSAR